MRRVLLLVLAVACLAACGSSSKTKTGPKKPVRGTPVEFGVKGGNIAPFTIAISPTGKVNENGHLSLATAQLSAAADSSVSAAVQKDLAGGGLSSKQCAGTLPDVGSRYVKALGRTVTVHGSCEPAFESLWHKLTAAVGVD